MKIKEISERKTKDTIELKGKVNRSNDPSDSEYGWSQRIVLKDDTGEIGCWLNLDTEDDKVAKGASIKLEGKLSAEYTDKRTGKKKRSINGCKWNFVEETQSTPKNVDKPVEKTEKVDDKVWKEKDLRMARESALKNVTQFVVAKIVKLGDRFRYAQEDVGFIYEDMDGIKSGIKEKRKEKAEEIVGETRFRPASTEQKKYIFGYRNNNDEFCKGIIDSRYMKKVEKREIGDPKKLSLEDATEWLLWWWGPDKKSGERKKREIENPRDENGNLINKPEEIKESGGLVKGDKTSVAKDILVDEVNALRRENFLSDDVKFKEELGYNPKLEELSEEDLLKLKELIKDYHPTSWDEK